MVAIPERALPATNISAPVLSIVWWPLRLLPSAQHEILPVRADEALRWSYLRETPHDLSVERGAPLIRAPIVPRRAPSGLQGVRPSVAASPSSPPHPRALQWPEIHTPAHCHSIRLRHPLNVPQPPPPGRPFRISFEPGEHPCRKPQNPSQERSCPPGPMPEYSASHGLLASSHPSVLRLSESSPPPQ